MKTKFLSAVLPAVLIAFTLFGVARAYIYNPTGSGGGGSQNINSVLTIGSDAGGQALSDVGTLTVTNIIATSTFATSTISNLGGTFDPTQQSGADIGAKTNTTYGNCAGFGCAVNIPAPSSGSSWSFTNGIAANTAAKPLRIVCGLGGSAINYATNGTTLLWTSTTGTSTKFNTGEGTNEGGSDSGIYNCNIQGTNGTTARTTVGTEEGGTNGDFNGYVDGSNISGMGTGVYYGANTSFNTIRNSTINFNGRDVSEPNVGGANCEDMRVLDSVIADANNQAGGDTDLKALYAQVSGNCQWMLALTSFDDAQVYADQFGGTANQWNFVDDHFENPNGNAYAMFAENTGATSITANFIGTDMMNDKVSGQLDQIEATGNVNLIGFVSNSNNNVTTATNYIVNPSASTTQIVWAGLVCKGAQQSTKIYGNVPCSPMGVGSDFSNFPSFYIASTTSAMPGFVGVGTSSPTAMFTVQLASSTAGSAKNAFDVWGIINAVDYLFERLDVWGHLITSGPAPSVTGGTSSVSGNDRNGTITLTGTALTSLTLTFSHAYAAAPDCVVSDNTSASVVDVNSISTTQMVIGLSVGLNSGTIWYICQQHQ